jgi:hypothetical protein
LSPNSATKTRPNVDSSVPQSIQFPPCRLPGGQWLVASSVCGSCSSTSEMSPARAFVIRPRPKGDYAMNENFVQFGNWSQIAGNETFALVHRWIYSLKTTRDA